MSNKILIVIIALFSMVILAITIRGVAGNQTEQELNTHAFTEGGPMELSPERGRFALAYSVVENHSLKFSLPIARFTAPDLGRIGNDYVSLFAPGVSFLIIPGYLIGRSLGASQVGAYSVIALFAVLNAVMIYLISTKLKTNKLAVGIGALIFLFATPAFAYAVNLYQHHISTFIILLGIYALVRWNNFWSLSLIWFLCAASISIDYPNLFLMLPIGFLALGQIFSLEKKEHFIQLNIKPVYVLSFLGVVMPLIFFLWFNKASYGNPFQFSGTVKQVKGVDELGNPLEKKDIYKQLGIEKTPIEKDKLPLEGEKDKKEAVGFFKTRNLVNGFYTHFISQDRGIIYYTPIVLMGIIGFFILYRTHPQIMALLISIIGTDVLLYSMWGDPYGGWAFGSRYLIPAYALMTIFIAAALTRFKNNYFVLSIFIVLFIYSILVNTLGAITSSANPPKEEVLNLEKISGTVQKYTYERNIDYLKTSGSKSFAYRNYLKNYMTATNFYWSVSASIILVSLGLFVLLILDKQSFSANKERIKNV